MVDGLLWFEFIDIVIVILCGGCIYYVVYLGGCVYDEFLVNVVEVEVCCVWCFEVIGFILGKFDLFDIWEK